jgi:hypothetical protein
MTQMTTLKSTDKRGSNSVPRLLINLRLTRAHISGWTGMSSKMVEVWLTGTYQPRPEERDRLVAHVREHAHTLLRLADAVEAEGRKEA